MPEIKKPWIPFHTPSFKAIQEKLTEAEFGELDAAYTMHAYELLVENCTPKRRGYIANLLAHRLQVSGIILQTPNYAHVLLADKPIPEWGWTYKFKDSEKIAKQALIKSLRAAADSVEASLEDSTSN